MVQHVVQEFGERRHRARLRDEAVEERRRDLEAAFPVHYLRELELVEEDGVLVLEELGERDRGRDRLARFLDAAGDPQQRRNFREHGEQARRLGALGGDLIHELVDLARERLAVDRRLAQPGIEHRAARTHQ